MNHVKEALEAKLKETQKKLAENTLQKAQLDQEMDKF